MRMLHEQEGDWAKALAWYDLGLAEALAPCGGGKPQRAQQQEQLAGAARALQQLGSGQAAMLLLRGAARAPQLDGATVRTFRAWLHGRRMVTRAAPRRTVRSNCSWLQGAEPATAAGPTVGQQRLQEQYAELAWRLGQWDAPPPPQPPAPAPPPLAQSGGGGVLLPSASSLSMLQLPGTAAAAAVPGLHRGSRQPSPAPMEGLLMSGGGGGGGLQWGAPAANPSLALGGGGGVAPGFHGAVVACLRALGQGDAPQFAALTQHATSGALPSRALRCRAAFLCPGSVFIPDLHPLPPHRRVHGVARGPGL